MANKRAIGSIRSGSVEYRDYNYYYNGCHFIIRKYSGDGCMPVGYNVIGDNAKFSYEDVVFSFMNDFENHVSNISEHKAGCNRCE